MDIYPPSEDYPEGYALNLTDGILRAKFRDSWESPELMEPRAIYPISIELYPTSNLFVAGHHIRLDISSSNFPRLDVNGNTGENPALSQVKVQGGEQGVPQRRASVAPAGYGGGLAVLLVRS